MDYSCNFIYPKKPPTVKVIHWKSKTSYKEHIINNVFFLDDTIQTILLKLINFLELTNEKLFPYIWDDDIPLRFKFTKNTWNNYNVNPFLSQEKDTPIIPSIQILSDRIMIFKTIHLVAFSDIKHFSTQTQKYYFPNDKDTFKENDIQIILKEQKLLESLWTIPPEKHNGIIISPKLCSYTRALFKVKIVPQKPKITFENLEGFDFIQFYDDSNNIFYKVKKDHKIPNDLFDEWRSIENKKDKSITIYSFIKKSTTSYMKMSIINDDVNIVYMLDVVENINYDTIKEHLDMTLAKIAIIESEPEVERLSLKTSLSVKNVNLKSLSVAFTKYPMIYNVPSKNKIQKNILDIQFKRVEKYGLSTDILDIIRTKLELGVSLTDIYIELSDYGMEENEIREYIEQINTNEPQKKKKRDFKNMGIIISIIPSAIGLNITINNASSFKEIQNALFWIRATILQWDITKSVSINTTKPQNKSPEKSLTPPPLFVPPKFNDSDSSGSALSLGGAVNHQRLFNTMLNNADPDIFAKTPDYARQCQANAFRQPIVMTIEEKEKIDKMGYKDSYDNFMIHGSSPENQNVYMCPRIYCPVSKIPMTFDQYVANGEKCPDGNDKPLLLYNSPNWYNSPTRPHYVGFLSKTGFNNVKLPCCFVKEQKDLPKTVKAIPKDKEKHDEDYIIDKIKQLQDGRYGSIPLSLHSILHPSVPHLSCKNTMKGKECVLRIGVKQHSDSLMTSIAYLLEYKNRTELLDTIKKELDPFTFLTLENGNVYTYFLSIKPNNKLIPKLKVWLLKEHPQYTDLFKLHDIIPYLEPDANPPNHIRFKIARQLLIYEAFNDFLDYICSYEEKNPYLLFDLIHHIGAVLIVWNRDNQNIATLKCPFTTKNKSWYDGSKLIPYIMVLYQETYYEPLIVIDQYKKIKQKISFTHFQNLQKLIESCPSMAFYEDKTIQDIFTLTKWIEIILSLPKKFKIKTLLLDPQDRAIGFFLENNIYIELNRTLSPFSLKNLVERCSIECIVYWEDIQNELYDIHTNIFDYRLLQIKIKKLGLGMNIGSIKQQTDTKIEAIYSVPKVIYDEKPKIPLIINDIPVYRNDSKKWNEVKKIIVETLLQKYSKIVKPVLQYSKRTQLYKLFEHFKSMDEPARVAVILEETPYHDKTILQDYYDEIILNKEYYYDSTKIYENKKEWVFNHKVPYELLENVKNPSSIKRPKNAPTSEVIVDTKIIDNVPLPDFLNVKKLTLNDLPSKWRSKKLKEYKIGISSHHVSQAFEWIANIKGIHFDIDDLRFYLQKQIFIMLEDPKNYELIVEDPTMRVLWNEKLGRDYRSTRELIEIGFKNKSVAQLQAIWKSITVVSLHDIDLMNISTLLNINFLILQKGKDIKEARGNINELVIASKFIGKDWEITPIFILHKQLTDDKKQNIYSILVDKNKKITYYHNGKDVPDEFNIIIKAHQTTRI
jgi:hypothetical protein